MDVFFPDKLQFHKPYMMFFALIKRIEMYNMDMEKASFRW